jgi:hypothetical protein
MSEENNQALPFFARFLEGQFCEDLSVEEMDNIQGGLTKLPPVELGHEKPIEPIEPIFHPVPYPIHRPIHRPIITSKIIDLYAPEPHIIFGKNIDTDTTNTPVSLDKV